AVTAWKRVAGEGLAQHATAMSLREKTLTVAVADDVWKKQLERMSKELVSRINKLLRRDVVTVIEFRVNARAINRSGARTTTTDKTAPPPASVVASAAEIEDAELRERFIRAATNCIDRREAQAGRAVRQSAIRNPKPEI